MATTNRTQSDSLTMRPALHMHTHTSHSLTYTHMHAWTYARTHILTNMWIQQDITNTHRLYIYIAEGPETPNEHKALYTVYLMPTVQRKGKYGHCRPMRKGKYGHCRPMHADPGIIRSHNWQSLSCVYNHTPSGLEGRTS